MRIVILIICIFLLLVSVNCVSWHLPIKSSDPASQSGTDTAIRSPFSTSKCSLHLVWVIRSHSSSFSVRVLAQLNSWVSFLTPCDALLFSSDVVSFNTSLLTSLGVGWAFAPSFLLGNPCPHGHDVGVCCYEALSIIALSSFPNFDYAFFIDDDVFAVPPLIRHLLLSYDLNYHTGTSTPLNGTQIAPQHPSKSTTIPSLSSASPSLFPPAVVPFMSCGIGICGGGGYALHRHHIRRLVAFPRFFHLYMRACGDLSYCDVVTGAFIRLARIPFVEDRHLLPWGLNLNDFGQLMQAQVATLHYYGGELTDSLRSVPEKMSFLQTLYRYLVALPSFQSKISSRPISPLAIYPNRTHLPRCVHLQQTYKVQPGLTWGTLPLPLMQEWDRMHCDAAINHFNISRRFLDYFHNITDETPDVDVSEIPSDFFTHFFSFNNN